MFGFKDEPAGAIGKVHLQARSAYLRAPRCALFPHRHQGEHPTLVSRPPRLNALA